MFKSKIETSSTTVTYFSDSESDIFPKKNIKKNDIPQKKIDLGSDSSNSSSDSDSEEEASSSKNLEQQNIPQKKIDLDSDSSNSSSDSDSEEEASSSKNLEQLDMDDPSPHSTSFINRSNYHSRFDQMAKPPELIAVSRVGFFSTSNNARFCPSENDYYNQENARYGFDRYEF